MKHSISKRMISALLTFVMVVGLIPIAAIPVFAQNISGLMYASGINANKGVVLTGETTLVMDTDLTVAYIEGNFDFNIEGSGTLTVTDYIHTGFLTVDKTPMTVNGEITAYDSVYVESDYFYALGGIGAENLVRINSSHAVIGGDEYGICSFGDIELNGSGGTMGINVGARDNALIASEGSIRLSGDITLNSTDALKYCVEAKGSITNAPGNYLNLIVTGSSGLLSRKGHINLHGSTIDVQAANGFAIMADSGTVNIECDTLIAVCDGGRPEEAWWPYGIGADGDITVTVSGTAGIAGGDYGVRSRTGNITLGGGATYLIGVLGTDAAGNGHTIGTDYGDVTLNGDFRLMVDHGAGDAIRAPEGIVTVEGTLRAEKGILADGFSFVGDTLEIDDGGVAAENDIYAYASNKAAITAKGSKTNALYSENGNITLEGGEFDILSEEDRTIYAPAGAITVMGSLTSVSNAEADLDEHFIERTNESIRAKDFTFSGTTLTVRGIGGIATDTIHIEADRTDILVDYYRAIFGDNVYIDSDYLWLQSLEKDDGVDTCFQCLFATESLTIYSDDATVIGGIGIALGGPADLHGNFTLVGMKYGGINYYYAGDTTVHVYGSLIAQTAGDGTAIDVTAFHFDGTSLQISGPSGIHVTDEVSLSGDDIRITATGSNNSAIWSEGDVSLAGNVQITTNGWYGINGEGDVNFDEGYFAIEGPKGNAQAVLVGSTLTMADSLRIVEPDGGHVNGNQINGAGDAAAKNVVIYSPIEEVNLWMSGPSDGLAPLWDSSAIMGLHPLYTFDSITWYENSVEMGEDATFKGGNTYTADVVIAADSGYRFLAGMMATVNGKDVVTTALLDGYTKMRLTVNFGTCKTAIDEVELDIAAPVEGNRPSTGVTRPNGAYYGVSSKNVTWMVSTDGKNYTAMSDTAKFEGGKYYRAYMDVTPSNSNYAFRITTEDGSVQPQVKAWVNGAYATVVKAYDQDPEQVITVYFDFGKCNDYIIEEIVITGVTTPVAGQHPSYDVNMFGTGYHVDTTKNSYYDAYWMNPPEKWYFLKNGVSWWDVTDGDYDYVYENDVFLPGHDYRCEIYVATDAGYEFVYDNYYDVYPSVTINGKPGELTFSSMSNLMWKQEVAFTFSCEAVEVSNVIVHGIDAPQKGKAPDYTATVAYPEYYQLDTDYGLNGSGIYWYDCEGRQLEAGEVFGDAGPYRLVIKFVPVYAEQTALCTFADNLSVAINGKMVTPYGQWDDVVVYSGAACAYYTFKSGASAPEIGALVTGSVTSSGYSGSNITVQLFRQGFPEPDYETVLQGNSVNYCFTNVPDGVYTLKVTKIYHRSYTATVTVSGAEIHNVILEKNGPEFADVSQSSWQYSFASYACERGLMAGQGTDGQGRIKFAPNNPITRAEFVQVLYNAEGKPAVTNSYNFPDVTASGWYKNAVYWAKSQDIANGLGDGSFGVSKNITRQDLALMLYKYAALKGCSLTAEAGKIDQFADGSKVASYAKTAMNWAVTNGILSGKGEQNKPLSTFRLDPTGTATRAECAAMLKNFMDAFGL